MVFHKVAEHGHLVKINAFLDEMLMNGNPMKVFSIYQREERE